MATSQYRKHILISRPRLDKNTGVWLPYVSVVADGDERNFYYRQFTNLNNAFKTEEQALSYGFTVAREWIDEPLGYKAGMKYAPSNTLISGILKSGALANRSRKVLIELSDALEHSRRLIDASSSIITKLKVKRLFEDAP